jgi:hypothetical protein
MREAADAGVPLQARLQSETAAPAADLRLLNLPPLVLVRARASAGVEHGIVEHLRGTVQLLHERPHRAGARRHDGWSWRNGDLFPEQQLRSGAACIHRRGPAGRDNDGRPGPSVPRLQLFQAAVVVERRGHPPWLLRAWMLFCVVERESVRGMRTIDLWY